MVPDADILAFVQPIAPTWCKTQHVTFTQEAFYGKDEQVPIRLLAVWDPDQKEPWYLATTLFSAAPVEPVYYLWFWTPLGNPAQLCYRRRAWWSNTS